MSKLGQKLIKAAEEGVAVAPAIAAWEAACKPADTLEENVRRFFEILDMKEFSANDVEFSPVKVEVYISSCRVLQSARLAALFKSMKEQSGYAKAS